MTPDELTSLAPWAAAAAAVLAATGEWLHARRVKRLGRLAFGPENRPRGWTKAVPWLRVAALAGLAWSLVTLMAFDNRSRDRDRKVNATRRLMVLLDVSPSMWLADAGESGAQLRAERASEVLKSVLDRVPGDNVRFTAANFYTETRLVVTDCEDRELVHHMTCGIPFHVTYKPGRTDLLKSLNQAGEIMKEWERKSATLLVISDGDAVAPTGLKPMPSAVSEVIFAGVGDPARGKFIDGHLSRQDTANLSQTARRLGGKFFDCNIRQIPSETLRKLNAEDTKSAQWRTDRRLVAVAVLGLCATVLALLPLLLEWIGSAWRPGVPVAPSSPLSTPTQAAR